MDVVTGAFSYTGRAIADELLRRGRPVRTLSRRNAPGDPLAERIERAQLQFRDEGSLREALTGADTLYNTYWVRFAHSATTFDRAGDGEYRVQPLSVEDVATICVDAGEAGEDVVLDAAGPDTPSYDELVRLVAAAVESGAGIAHVPSRLVLALGSIIGSLRRDVLLTREELQGLQAELLVSGEPPLGTASFRSWVAANGEHLGRGYVSELARNFRPYDPL